MSATDTPRRARATPLGHFWIARVDHKFKNIAHLWWARTVAIAREMESSATAQAWSGSWTGWRHGRLTQLAARPWVDQTLAYLTTTALLALLTHSAAHPMTFLGARLVSAWFPVAFAIQAILVARIAAGLPRAEMRVVHLLDLATWLVPIGFMLAVQLGGTDYGAWLTASVLGKMGSGVFALAMAVRRGRRDWDVAATLAALALICYLLTIPFTRSWWDTTRGIGLTGDEPHYLIVTVSLLQDHDLFIEDDQAQLDSYASFYPADIRPGHTAPARDGHLASWHDIGLSVLATLPYALGGWHMVLAMIALAAALALRELYLVLRLACIRPSVALLTAALVGVSLPFAVYANLLFPEIVIALPVTAALRQVWAAQRGMRASPLLAGLALATLPPVHFRAWPLVAIIALAGVLVWRDRWARLAVLAPAVAVGVAYAALSSWLFERFLLTPLQMYNKPVFQSLLVDLIYQAKPWLDSWDGLLFLTPVLVLALAGAPLVARMGWAGLATTVGAAVYSVAIGVFLIFSGPGWAPQGRYMVPVIPLLAIPLAAALERLPRWALGYVALPLAAWGVGGTFIALADRRVLFSTTDLDQHGPATILAGLFGLPLSRLAPNWQHPGVGSFVKVAAAVVVIATLALLLAHRPSWRREASAAAMPEPAPADR